MDIISLTLDITCIKECPIDLKNENFMLEDTFHVTYQLGRRHIMRCFLFSKLLVFTILDGMEMDTNTGELRDMYKYFHHVLLSLVTITLNSGSRLLVLTTEEDPKMTFKMKAELHTMHIWMNAINALNSVCKEVASPTQIKTLPYQIDLVHIKTDKNSSQALRDKICLKKTLSINNLRQQIDTDGIQLYTGSTQSITDLSDTGPSHIITDHTQSDTGSFNICTDLSHIDTDIIKRTIFDTGSVNISTDLSQIDAGPSLIDSNSTQINMDPFKYNIDSTQISADLSQIDAGPSLTYSSQINTDHTKNNIDSTQISVDLSQTEAGPSLTYSSQINTDHTKYNIDSRQISVDLSHTEAGPSLTYSSQINTDHTKHNIDSTQISVDLLQTEASPSQINTDHTNHNIDSTQIRVDLSQTEAGPSLINSDHTQIDTNFPRRSRTKSSRGSTSSERIRSQHILLGHSISQTSHDQDYHDEASEGRHVYESLSPNAGLESDDSSEIFEYIDEEEQYSDEGEYSVEKQEDVITVQGRSSKYERDMLEIFTNLLDSEQSYVNLLETVVKRFIPLMGKNGNFKELRTVDSKDLFAYIPELYLFHKTRLYPDLLEAQNIFQLASVFLKWQEEFKIYFKFIRKIDQCCKNAYNYNEIFQVNGFLDQGTSLESYILEPVKRLAYYKMFLKNATEVCSKFDSEKRKEMGGQINFEDKKHLEFLNQALSVIKDLNNFSFKSVILTNIINCKVNLSEQGGLIHENYFVVKGKSIKKTKMRCFLFEKCLILANISGKAFNEKYIYHSHMRIKDLGILTPEKKMSSTFQVYYSRTYMDPLDFKSDYKTQEKWVASIYKILKVGVVEYKRLQSTSK